MPPTDADPGRHGCPGSLSGRALALAQARRPLRLRDAAAPAWTPVINHGGRPPSCAQTRPITSIKAGRWWWGQPDTESTLCRGNTGHCLHRTPGPLGDMKVDFVCVFSQPRLDFLKTACVPHFLFHILVFNSGLQGIKILDHGFCFFLLIIIF